MSNTTDATSGTPAVATPNPNNRNPRNNVSRFTTPAFKGSTFELHGNVFQTKAEQKKKSQYQTTMDALKIYASTTYKKESKFLAPLWRDLKKPNIPLPKEPKEESKEVTTDETVDGVVVSTTKTVTVPVSRVKQAIFDEKIKNWVREEQGLEATLHSLYNVIWGQCSPSMQEKIRSRPKFHVTEEKEDVIGLLKEIKGISHQFESHENIYDSLYEAKKGLYNFRQQPQDSNSTHLRSFQNLVDVIEHYGGNIADDSALTKYETEYYKKINETASSTKVKERAKNKMLAIMFLKSTDRGRYNKLLSDLKDQRIFGTDAY